jgi:hypothetical protein
LYLYLYIVPVNSPNCALRGLFASFASPRFQTTRAIFLVTVALHTKSLYRANVSDRPSADQSICLGNSLVKPKSRKKATVETNGNQNPRFGVCGNNCVPFAPYEL